MRTLEATRELGGTGLRVSRLGLGLAALGRPGYINLGHDRDFPGGRSPEAMEVATHEVLDAAWAAGIRYLDAARSYGRAEAFLASWLEARAIPPEAVTVGTKWGYTYVADWQTDAPVHEVKDHSLATLRRQIGESTALLGSQLDLLQIHSATLESGVLRDGAVLDELARLRADGVVRAIGLTLSGPAQGEALAVALDLELDALRVFDTVQATYNLLERSMEQPLAEAHRRGMGVLVKEALANGRLVRGDESAPLVAVAPRHAAGPDAVALAFVLSRPWADVVLLGSATPAQLAANLQAAEVTLDEADMAAIEPLRESPEDYWRKRSALPWI